MAKCFIDNKVRRTKSLNKAETEVLVMKELNRIYTAMDIEFDRVTKHKYAIRINIPSKLEYEDQLEIWNLRSSSR